VLVNREQGTNYWHCCMLDRWWARVNRNGWQLHSGNTYGAIVASLQCCFWAYWVSVATVVLHIYFHWISGNVVIVAKHLSLSLAIITILPLHLFSENKPQLHSKLRYAKLFQWADFNAFHILSVYLHHHHHHLFTQEWQHCLQYVRTGQWTGQQGT